MILVDMNQVTLSNLMIQIGRSDEVDPDMVRHMVLNSLRGYRNRFCEEYGELVLCYDNKGNWRREYFPNYKHGRRKDRKASKLDWGSIFDTLHLIKQELQNHFPYKVLEVENVEADDIIASVVSYVAETPSHYEKVLILSGDKDFIQLQKHSFVTQYSPVLKKFVNGIDPDVYIKEHILKGDRSDGVPNFLSPDNCFVNELRQRPISKKKLATWIDLDPEDFCNEEMLRNYQRNRTLIDLTQAPDWVSKTCVEAYLNSKVNDRSGLLNYFIKHRLKNHMENIGDF
jgi:hypothetical protein|tara:strand:+ start:2004 stop:2858 length:855 start_codon:yes stop_codon:yes gene_type:complete